MIFGGVFERLPRLASNQAAFCPPGGANERSKLQPRHHKTLAIAAGALVQSAAEARDATLLCVTQRASRTQALDAGQFFRQMAERGYQRP